MCSCISGSSIMEIKEIHDFYPTLRVYKEDGTWSKLVFEVPLIYENRVYCIMKELSYYV